MDAKLSELGECKIERNELKAENKKLSEQLKLKKLLLACILRIFKKYVIDEDVSWVLKQLQMIEDTF